MRRKIVPAVLAAAILFLIHPTFGQVQHGVKLTWTLSTSTGVASQNVYRGTVSGGPYTVVSNQPATAVSYLDPVVDGKTYFYVVTAVSQGPIVLESAFSNQVTATAPGPVPNPQTGLAASDQ